MRPSLAGCLALLFTVAGLTRVASTYTVYSQTVDEPAHLATGMEWLDEGRFEYEPQHPPLARVAVALPPYLDGLRSQGDSSFWDEGNSILALRGTYLRNLALARLGTLPFLLLACAVVWLWARWASGPAAGAAAVGLLTLVPPVLGHGGLATTDMAAAATLAAAVLAFARWMDRPTRWWSLALGAVIALACLAKLSNLLFLPACFALVLLGRYAMSVGAKPGVAGAPVESRRLGVSELAVQVLAAGLAFSLTLWAGYRFSISYPETFGGRVPFPAAEFLRGIRAVYEHAKVGHPSYFLGELGREGWWSYYPVVLLIKTPLPILAFAALGIASMVHARGDTRWRLLAPALAAAAVVAAAMPSTINVGVRHVLAVYPFVAIVAGYGLVAAWNAGRARWAARAAVVCLGGWLLVANLRSHPDHLTYFNEIAGAHPERFVVDSDLCWGQDYFRLVDEVRARGIDSIWVAYHGTLDVEPHRLPGMRTLPQYQRVTGWVAASIFELKGVRRSGWLWLNEYVPRGKAGDSIWLFHIPDRPDSSSHATPASVRAQTQDAPRRPAADARE